MTAAGPLTCGECLRCGAGAAGVGDECDAAAVLPVQR